MTEKFSKDIADQIIKMNEDLKKSSKIEDKVKLAVKLSKTLENLPKN